MGKVDCLSFPSCECVFRSEDHNPPHFHLKHKQECWEIRVYLNTTTETRLDYRFKTPSSRTKPISGDLQRMIRIAVVKERITLMKEWDKKVLVKDDE